MPTVEEMAQSHLSNVQKAIIDLENQKKQIEEEISKLSSYLQEGYDTIKKGQSNE